jgi:hypothetical protein
MANKKPWTTQHFAVRPQSQPGEWISDSGRFAEYARMQLEELLELAAQITEEWPFGIVSLREDSELHASLYLKTRKRDLLSDSVKMYSAMAVEGFLNYYGVVRLGGAAFDKYIERLGPVEKVTALLKICDSVTLDSNDKLVVIVRNIAYRRNALVHVNTTEICMREQAGDRLSPIPGAAVEAVKDMSDFFREFVALIPEAKWHLSNSEAELLLGASA